MSSPDTGSGTCSRGSAGGLSPSRAQDSPTPPGFSPSHARVSRFRALAADREQPTPATYGPLFTHSSPSFALQCALESRLRDALDGNGSPLYALTWRTSDMPSGAPICLLRALARRTSGSASGSRRSGWTTPKATEPGGYSQQALAEMIETGSTAGHHPDLTAQAQMAGWTTPTAMSRSGGLQSDPRAALRRRAQGHQLNLDDQAVLAGGSTPTGSTAPTALKGRLNPEHTRWLMGFPVGWTNCADTATR